MTKCPVCSDSVTGRHLKITCSDCKLTCHAKCVSMSKEDVDVVVAEGMVWRCPPCAKVRRKSMSAVAKAEKGEATISDVIFMLEQAKEERKRIETDLGASLELCHRKIDENSSLIEQQTNQLAECLQTIEVIKQENQELKDANAKLTMRVEDCEQYSRSNCVEIYGVPVVQDENVLQLVKQVGLAVGFEIEDVMVDICHRLGKNKSKKGGPPGIIAKFVRRFDKQRLMDLKKKKPDLSTRHIGMAMDNPVYINDSLSFARRELLRAARDFKTRHGYKYVWVKEGKIFIKKLDSEPAILVTHMDMLRKLK